MPMSDIKMRDDEKLDIEASSVSGISAFLGKLWRMVEDLKTDHLISWGKTGTTFVIKNQIDFSKTILPNYYKHNNIASFIRQLNMYGFHKIVSTTSGSLESTDNDEIEFSHPNFVKGRPYLLEHIKRKMNNPKENIAKHESSPQFTESIKRVLTDVKQIRGKQDHLNSQLCSVKQENEILWRELSLLRQKHAAQQNILNKLIRFLVSLAQPTNHGLVKRRLQPLMLKDSTSRSKSKHGRIIQNADHVYTIKKRDAMSPGPTIHEIHPSDVMVDVEVIDSPALEVTADIPDMIDNESILSDASVGSPEPLSTAMLLDHKTKKQLQTVYITPDTQPHSRNFITTQLRSNVLNNTECVLPDRTPNALMELVEAAADDSKEYITVLPEDTSEMLTDNIPTTIITEGLSDSDTSTHSVTQRRKIPTTRRKTDKKSNLSVYSPSKVSSQKHKAVARRKLARNMKNTFTTDKATDVVKNANETYLFDVELQNEPYIEIHTPAINGGPLVEEVPAELISIVNQNRKQNPSNKQLKIDIPATVDEVMTNISPTTNSAISLNAPASPSMLLSPNNHPLHSPMKCDVNLGAGCINAESSQIQQDEFMEQINDCIDNAQNMSVACAGNTMPTSKVGVDDISNQIDNMQTDLNSLKEYMQSQAFNMDIMGVSLQALKNQLFSEEPVDYNMLGNQEQYQKSNEEKVLENDIINAPSMLDFTDFFSNEWSQPETPVNTEDSDYCSLNTPQIENNVDECQQLFAPPSKKIKS